MRSSFEKTSCTRPMPRFDFISPLYTARPADSWPRCWRIRKPRNRSVVTGVVPEQPMIPHFSRGRRSEISATGWSTDIVNASSPRSNLEVSSSVRSRRRHSTSSACDTRADRSAGTGCGRSSVPSCQATRSPSSCRPPTSWGDVDDVVSSDNREVHLPLGLVVLHLLRVAEDEVHVRVESIEDSAVPPPAFQLNHHVRTDPLVEERKALNHGAEARPRREVRVEAGPCRAGIDPRQHSDVALGPTEGDLLDDANARVCRLLPPLGDHGVHHQLPSRYRYTFRDIALTAPITDSTRFSPANRIASFRGCGLR